MDHVWSFLLERWLWTAAASCMIFGSSSGTYWQVRNAKIQLRVNDTIQTRIHAERNISNSLSPPRIFGAFFQRVLCWTLLLQMPSFKGFFVERFYNRCRNRQSSSQNCVAKVNNQEVFALQLGDNVLRRSRVLKRGGGALIAVKNCSSISSLRTS